MIRKLLLIPIVVTLLVITGCLTPGGSTGTYEGEITAYRYRTNGYGGRTITIIYFKDGTKIEVSGELSILVGGAYQLELDNGALISIKEIE